MPLNVKDWFWDRFEENRRLTLKVAHAFPEETLLTATPVPGMRPYARMLLESASLEDFVIRGLADGEWKWSSDLDQRRPPDTVSELFHRLKATRDDCRAAWERIPVELLLTPHPPVPGYGAEEDLPLYWLQGEMENEIHHRGQAYAYLRLLGIEPPFFWDRD